MIMCDVPSTRSLRAFEVAAKRLSVRRAAEDLFITPAAVSKQIKNLELFLGCELFIRHQSGLELTEFGKIYLYHVQRSLSELRQATKNVMQTTRKRVIKLRSYSTFSVYWLVPRIADFYALHPDIVIDITTTSRWVEFSEDNVDAAIRLGTGRWSDMYSFKLVSNRLAPVCSPHMATLLNSVDDLRHQTLLHAQARLDDWGKWLSKYGPLEVDPHAGQRYESSILAYQAAMQGQGISMGQLDLIKTELLKGNLVLPFDEKLDMGEFTYYLVIPNTQELSPDLETFRNWICSYDGANKKL